MEFEAFKFSEHSGVDTSSTEECKAERNEEHNPLNLHHMANHVACEMFLVRCVPAEAIDLCHWDCAEKNDKGCVEANDGQNKHAKALERAHHTGVARHSTTKP